MISPTFDGLEDTTRDVCIVGAGPVGISLAVALDRMGFSVLLLESGKGAADKQIQDLSDAEIVDPRLHDDMSIAMSRQLGGTSNLWGGFCVKYDPVDFVPRSGLVDAVWPIGYDELLPYYRLACSYTQSGDPVFECPIAGVNATDPSFSFDTVERSAGQQKLQVIHRKALAQSQGIDVRLCATVAGLRFGENGRVTDIDVVRSDGDQRTRVKVSNLVIAAGGLESTRLLLSAQRQAPLRFGGSNGPLGRYYMGHLIGDVADIEFAKGGIEDAFGYFIDSHGSYVKRRLVPSMEVQLSEGILNSAMWPIVPPIADARHGSAILSSIYMALAFDPIAKFLVADAIRKRHIPPHPVALKSHLMNIVMGLPSAVAFSADFLWHRYLAAPRIPGFFVRNAGRRYPLAYHSEQVPRAESMVTLSDQTDRTGLEKLRIDLRFHESDARSIVRTHELLADWLQETGFGLLHWRSPPSERIGAVLAQAQHGTHQIGIARMGRNAAEGVVDRNLKVFGTPNLYVASTAVLPTSGQANPTLTAVALALRLADHFRTAAPAIEHSDVRRDRQKVS